MRIRALYTLVPMLAGLGLYGCSAANDSNPDNSEETARASSPIINGTEVTNDPIGTPLFHTVPPHEGWCTSTMLTDRWLLTARHCVTEDSTIMGKVLPYDQFDATPQWGSPIKAAAVVPHPSLDVALVLLESSVVDANGHPRATPLSLGHSGDLNGPFQTVYCQGWGKVSVDTKTIGVLRSAQIRVSGASGDGFNVAATGPQHQLPWTGDSGGSCYLFINGHYQALGVISTCVIDASSCHLVGVERFRDWVEGTIGNAVAVFVDPGYKGWSQSLLPSGPTFGSYNTAQLTIGDNKISSWIVPSNFSANLYRDPNYSNLILSGSGVSGNVPSNVNDQTSSASVSGGAVFYEHGNFGGQYRLATSASTIYLTGTVQDNMFSSLFVPAGWTVSMFDNGPLATNGARNPSPGASVTFTEGVYGSIDPSFNDLASYIVVREPAAVYANASFGGSVSQLLPGCYDVGQMGIGNDSISSVYVPNGLAVQLFQNGGLSGTNIMYTTSTSYVGASWNDKASGVCVYAQPTAWCGTVLAGEALQTGTSVWSCDHRFYLIMRSDGNLALYQNGQSSPYWTSNTSGTTGTVAVMQNDGNFVLYDATQKALWSSGTYGDAARNLHLAVQDDGNLVVYQGTQWLWASNTCCR